MRLTKMKINLGSGYKSFPDYINIDSDPNCKPDILLNLDDPNLSIPLESNSVEKVIAHHILEHIGTGYFKLLQELYRICKNGAIIDVRVPHHFHETFFSDPTHKRPITVEGLRLFSKKRNKHEIESGGTSSTLGIMYDVDFEVANFNMYQDPFYEEMFKEMEPMQAYRFLRETVNTTVEVQITLIVVKE